MTNVLRMAESGPAIHYANEDDLQSGMAQLAEAYGWRAQREVVIPGWGRLDLVLHAAEINDYTAVIEFKQELTKLSMIRKAFQQADGYQKWLSSEKQINRMVWLSAPVIDYKIANDIAYAYRDSVELLSTGTVMNFITGDYAVGMRMGRAREHHDSAARQFRVSVHAHNEMTKQEQKIRRTKARSSPAPTELVET